jgi:Bifunctional DNA primase/polymerase, N-terminal
MNPRLRAARRYAHQGWFVLPCDPGGNVLCEHGVLDASVDEVVIRTWWARWPRANVGTPTGMHAIVLDVNGPEGEQTLAELTAKHGPLPATAEVQTGKGRHLHFSPNGSMIPNGGGRLGPGVDVLGVGKCVILPPSADETGLRSEWLSLVNPAPLPTWIGKALAERATHEQSVESLTSTPESAKPRAREIARARDFLLRTLEAGPVSSKQLQREAKGTGISERTLFRAKAVLRVKAVRSGFGQDGAWSWELHPNIRSSAKPDISMRSSKAVSLKNVADNVVAGNGSGNGSLSAHAVIPITILGAEQQSATPKGSA